MKGLILKDWYMMKKYCRAYLLIAVIFTAASVINTDNLFFVFYPCLLCSMIPINLIAYDERSHWMQYSGTLPYKKSQIVSSKYLIGLLTQIAMLLVTGITQGVRMSINGGFQINDFLVLMLMILIIATLSSSMCLPFIFKLGVEKGRIIYYVMIGLVCGGGLVASNLFKEDLYGKATPNASLIIICLVGIGIYILSWYLSIVFYKKREIY